MEDNRGNVYFDDAVGKWVYRASGLGNCIGALVRERMGETPVAPPNMMLEKYAEGVELEDKILDHEKVLGAGWDVLRAKEWLGLYPEVNLPYVVGLSPETKQLRIEIPVGSSALVRCHPDGLANNLAPSIWAAGAGVSESAFWKGVDRAVEAGAKNDKWRVVEAKALSADYARVVAREKPEFYKWQLSVEMAGTGLMALYLHGIKVGMEQGEEGADKPPVSLDTVNVELIDVPPYTLNQIKARVLSVERMAKAGEVPACEWKQWPCGFWQTHDTSVGIWADDTDEVDEETAREINWWATRYDTNRAKVERYDAQRKEAGEELKKLVEGKVKSGKWRVTRVKSTAKGIDTKAMKDDGVYEKYATKDLSKDYVRVEEVKDAE